MNEPTLPNYQRPNVTPKGIALVNQPHKYAKPLNKLMLQRLSRAIPGRHSGKIHITHKKVIWH